MLRSDLILTGIRRPFLLTILGSFIITAALAIACWDIQFWPSDAEDFYMPASKALPLMQYPSQMHGIFDQDKIKWLHGKEFHVLAIALFQRWMEDTETLRPLFMLGLVCIFFSSLAIFLIARRLWGEREGLLAWTLFAFSFWPYLYVLFTKHQTQGLLFFLLAVLCLLRSRGPMYAAAGMCMAVSIFSSPASSLYLPFIACAFFYTSKDVFKNALFFILGFGALLIYINFPDVIGNLQEYWRYVKISGEANHFLQNEQVLLQWLPDFFLKDTRSGWPWVFQYFILVMPVVFPLYLAAVVYLLASSFGSRNILLVVLSFSPVLLAELKGVAQYGANYFPALLGMIMLIVHAFSFFLRGAAWPRFKYFLGVLLAVHLCWNGYIFVSDIYPCRMVTTLMSKTLEQKGVREVATYARHPLYVNIVRNLELLPHPVKIDPVAGVAEVSSGYFILPPVSTDTIYRAANSDYTDFDHDLVVNQLVRNNKLQEYSIASFKTMGSSLIWGQEEEILAYRYLSMGQFLGGDKSRAWILDAGKVHKDLSSLKPFADDLFLLENKVRNIGTATRTFMYRGYVWKAEGASHLSGLMARVYAVNGPADHLRAFILKWDGQRGVWRPYGKHFISRPVPAASMGKGPSAKELTLFAFEVPLELQAGEFLAVIYRDGSPSDKSFFRIYTDHIKLRE